MRKSFDTLAAIVTSKLEEDVYSGHVFVFANRPRNRLKVLVWDRSGFLLCAKRLEKGSFAWPESSDISVTLTPEELSLLLSGIDLRGAERRKWYSRPETEEEKKLVS